ncbi:MAG: tRNA 5-hydroxyuridine modification protein YegQ [Gammaproteobacteria bacterium]|nr:tRNA 5-hydroxyuridine modification protein YegQ [Gammaproteobacteria bacterium]
MSIELLSPAGTLKNMRYAFAYGADAVYAGQPRYSLRVRNNDFDMDNLQVGIDEAHALGKKFFVASNILPHNAKLKTYMTDMAPVVAMGPDALIMADPGLIMMVREKWPEMPVHLSVQANTMNWAAVKFWKSVGIERVILSRELSLDEVEEIRQKCPDMEIEVFVHGALCIAYSGRCLLSGYINKRDPNQGTCTNACRWDYKVHEAETDVSGDIKKIEMPVIMKPGQVEGIEEKVYMFEEGGRPGELMPVYEDEHGTYVMNSKDLRAVQHVQRLMQIGVDSLKIEGRTKSHYYVARTAQVYRMAIDAAQRGENIDKDLMMALDNLANRGYTEGFYRRHVPEEYQNYATGNSVATQQQFVGEITAVDEQNRWVDIDVKNKFGVGDSLELMLPTGNINFSLPAMTDQRGREMQEALGGGYQVRIPLPEAAKGDVSLGLLMRNF